MSGDREAYLRMAADCEAEARRQETEIARIRAQLGKWRDLDMNREISQREDIMMYNKIMAKKMRKRADWAREKEAEKCT